MSEKITFQELVDSIADKTDNSKKFTHDFLKDFADVINKGLEEDGKVNIAGFGKFGLRRLNERKGHNPQTGESITIPAHNKVIFKPYKQLREIVNAPYKEMEAEIIDEGNDADQSRKKDNQERQESVPAAPPPPAEDEIAENTERIEHTEEDFFDEQTAENTSSKFSFDEKKDESETDPDDSYNDDVVEFKHGQDTSDEDLEAFISGEPPDKEKYSPTADEEEVSDEEPAPMENDPAAFSSEENYETGSTEVENIADPEPAPQPEFPKNTGRNRKTNNNSLILAAAVIILLLVAGSGYMLMQSQQGNESDIDQASSAVTGIIDQKQDNDAGQQASRQDEEQQTVQSQQADRQEPQQTTETKTVNMEINQGQTLWGMAERQYDNPYLWPWIYDANKSSIDDPDLIIAGKTLTVPIPSGAQNSLTSSDSLEIAVGYVETYKWYKNKGVDNAKLYLWVAANYDEEILNRTDFEIDKDDLAFANRSQVQ